MATTPVSITETTTSNSIIRHDATYYSKCMLGGVLACGLTHTIITPLDITKVQKHTHAQLPSSK